MVKFVRLFVVGIGCAMFAWLLRHLYEEKKSPIADDMVNRLRKNGL